MCYKKSCTEMSAKNWMYVGNTKFKWSPSLKYVLSNKQI